MSENTSTTRIKETIRALLKLGENDAGFDAEAEKALRFARKLMMRHGLDQSDCEELRDPDEVAAAADVKYGEVHCYSEASTLSWWERTLTSTICETIGSVQWYFSTKHTRKTPHGTIAFGKNGKPQRATRMTFYGPAEDCATASDLLDEWRQVIVAMARMKFGGVFRGKGRSYCEGFAGALWSKLKDIQGEEMKAMGHESSNALMLINSTAIMKAKKDNARDWLKEEKGVKLAKPNKTSYRKHHGDAYTDGKKDGQTANLSTDRKKRLEGQTDARTMIGVTILASIGLMIYLIATLS